MRYAKEIMTDEFNVVRKGVLVSDVYKMIKEKNVDTTIVVDKKGVPIGIVTIWNLTYAKALNYPFNKTPVEEIMSFPVVTMLEDESIEESANKMMINRIKNVVIVDRENKLKGLITAKQLLECDTCLVEFRDKRSEIGRVFKIAMIGGTGRQGRGLALRWAKAGHTILIGSRKRENAETISKELIDNLKNIGVEADVRAGLNREAAKDADIIVLTVPYASLEDIIMDIKDSLKEGQIIISPVVPLEMRDNGEVGIEKHRISAAEKIALMTKVLGVKTIAAFHTIPATNLSRVEFPLNYDLVVCGNDEDAKKVVMTLISHIPNLRPLDGGSLKNAVTLEYLTSLAINIGRTYKKTTIGLKFL